MLTTTYGVKKIQFLPSFTPREKPLEERRIFVRVSWADPTIPAKVYHAVSQRDAEKFVEHWRQLVVGEMDVRMDLPAEVVKKDALALILGEEAG